MIGLNQATFKTAQNAESERKRLMAVITSYVHNVKMNGAGSVETLVLTLITCPLILLDVLDYYVSLNFMIINIVSPKKREWLLFFMIVYFIFLPVAMLLFSLFFFIVLAIALN